VAARRADDPSNARALAYRVGRDCAVDRVLLAGASVGPIRDWPIPQFPLKGGEIVARGVAAGPEVARILRAVEARWIEEGFPDQTRVATLLDEGLGAR
jgi:poly(A) polymerase